MNSSSVSKCSGPSVSASVRLLDPVAHIQEEVQLLFTTVPATVGWYSLAYNAAAAGIISVAVQMINANMSLQRLSSLVVSYLP